MKIQEKHIVALIVGICYFVFPATGYGTGTPLINHLLFPLSHGNIFHILGNLLCLLLLKGELFLVPASMINFVCSYLPVWSIYGKITTTMGMSGILFAIVGIKYGKYGSLKTFCKNVCPFAFGMIVLPHINWCIHAYCAMAGYIYGYIWKTFEH